MCIWHNSQWKTIECLKCGLNKNKELGEPIVACRWNCKITQNISIECPSTRSNKHQKLHKIHNFPAISGACIFLPPAANELAC